MDEPQAGLREQSASQLSIASPCPPPQARSIFVAYGPVSFRSSSLRECVRITSTQSPIRALSEPQDSLTVDLLEVSLPK